MFCFVFLFFISIHVAFLLGAKEKLCDFLAQARVPPSVLVPAVCAVDQNQKEAICCQSSGFCHEPCDISCFFLQSTTVWRWSSVGQDPIDVSGVGGGRLVAGKILPCDVSQPQKLHPLTYGAELVIFHYRAMMELVQEQLWRGRTEPKALQNLRTPPLLLWLRFPTLLVPARHELKSLEVAAQKHRLLVQSPEPLKFLVRAVWSSPPNRQIFLITELYE